MKKFHYNLIILLVAASAILFTACKEEVNNNLSVSPNTLDFGANEPNVEKTFVVETDVDDWTVSGEINWLNIHKALIAEGEGENKKFVRKLRVKAARNTTTSTRSATLTIKAGNAAPVNVTVNQAAAN